MPSTPPQTAPPTLSQQIVRWAALLLPASVLFSVDQYTKAWMLAHLSYGDSFVPIPALEPWFKFTLSYNTGAAFSLLPQLGDIFLLIALAMIIGIFVYYRRVPTGRWIERIALGILLGGVCSNALDRVRFDHVIDFFHVRLPGVVSNVSNFADHGIVIGIVILFVAQILFDRVKQPDKQD